MDITMESLEKRGCLREYALGDSTVWLLCLQGLDREDYGGMYACLSTERQKKTDRIGPGQKKSQSVGAGYLLYLLKKRFSIEEEPVIMPGGKPVFQKSEGICFNISHSGEYAALAFGNRKLGLDIEFAKRTDLKVAKRFFRREEYEYLAELEETVGADAFCRIWTGKEAVLKAAGTGLSVSLNGFSVLGETKEDPEKEESSVETIIYWAENRYELCQQKLTEKGCLLWISVAVLHE